MSRSSVVLRIAGVAGLIVAAALALLRAPQAGEPSPVAPRDSVPAAAPAVGSHAGEVPIAPRELVADAEPAAAAATAAADDGGVAVRGVVVDAAGDPVPTGFVSVLAVGCDDGEGAEIGADGAFALPVLPRGFYRLVVESPLRPTLVHGPVLLDACAAAEPLRLRLPHPAALRGVVETRASAEDLSVVCIDAGGITRRAPVEPNGRFALQGLSPGPHRVLLQNGARDTVLAGETVYLAEGETRDAEFVLPRR